MITEDLPGAALFWLLLFYFLLVALQPFCCLFGSAPPLPFGAFEELPCLLPRQGLLHLLFVNPVEDFLFCLLT
jgi:hypothetical protein